MSASTSTPGPFALPASDRSRLERLISRALRRARRRGEPVLAAVTYAVAPTTDPGAVAFASRRGDEPLFCLEQPDRDRTALAALGCVKAIEPAGPDRFRAAAEEWRALVACAQVDLRPGPRASGPVAVGGFAFAPDGAGSPHWHGYAPASLHVPQIAVAREGAAVELTACVLAEPDDVADERLERIAGRLEDLREAPLPLLDPDPAVAARVVSPMPPSHYESAVARAVERIRAGALEKVVLAREVEAHAPAGHDTAAAYGVLREAFPACFVLAVARGDATFLAASPELLVRRQGQRASTVALAGSTRRSADPAVDDHLGEQLMRSAKNRSEQDIVARRIAKTLGPYSVWVAAAAEPSVVRIANIQHLATPIRAQLAAPIGAVDLAGILHPTPAVGGEPWPVAEPLIPELEGLDRGWYAAPMGWIDAAEDGEFCVALRSALVRGNVARCYAGVGVVADSDPAAELAETEIKLQALLPVLAG